MATVGGDAPLSKGGTAWAVFEGARNPYVSSVMEGDPVRGQQIISSWSQYSGWIVMATAPFLGASIDKLGRRKRWLALVYALSGTATVWLGSFLVNLGAQVFKSQQGGFAAVALLLLVGFVGLLFVKGGDRRVA